MYRTWQQIANRCVAMARYSFSRTTWTVAYRAEKGSHLTAFAVYMAIDDEDIYATPRSGWREFRTARPMLRRLDLPMHIRKVEHFSVDSGPCPFERAKGHPPLCECVDCSEWRSEMEANDMDTPPGVGVTVGYKADDNEDGLQPWDDLDTHGRQ